MNTPSIPNLELDGHRFEIVKLYKDGQEWRAQFAVDNILYPEFLEPHVNVADMNEDSFLSYMKQQALTMAGYWQQQGENA